MSAFDVEYTYQRGFEDGMRGRRGVNMYEELKAWANKWNIAYTEENHNGELCIKFDGKIYTDATYGEGKISFEYDFKSGGFKWSGDMC